MSVRLVVLGDDLTGAVIGEGSEDQFRLGGAERASYLEPVSSVRLCVEAKGEGQRGPTLPTSGGLDGVTTDIKFERLGFCGLSVRIDMDDRPT